MGEEMMFKCNIDYEILPLHSGAEDFFEVSLKFRDPKQSYNQIEEIHMFYTRIFEEFVKFLGEKNAISEPVFYIKCDYKEFTLKLCTQVKK